MTNKLVDLQLLNDDNIKLIKDENGLGIEFLNETVYDEFKKLALVRYGLTQDTATESEVDDAVNNLMTELVKSVMLDVPDYAKIKK